MDFDDFLLVAKKYRAGEVEEFRRNAGYTREEVEEFRSRFARYDRDGSGDVSKKEMVRLLEDLYPQAQSTPAERERLRGVLKNLDQDGDGTLDFGEFLMMMRDIQDQKYEEALEKERLAIQETGFSLEEVEGFRTVFKHGDLDMSTELTARELRAILQRAIMMDDERFNELIEIVMEQDDDGNGLTDFPEFLRIMHRIQHENFHGINQEAEKRASRLSS